MPATSLSPFGEPKRFQHTGENVVVLLRLAPDFVQQVAGDEYALDPSRFELARISAHRPRARGDRQTPPRRPGNRGRAEPHARRIARRAAVGPPASSIRLRVIARARARSAALAAETQARARLHRCQPSRRHGVVRPRRTPRHEPRPFRTCFARRPGFRPIGSCWSAGSTAPETLLRDTDLPITEIAEQVGCASHSHLSVLFHRETGVTPRDFRRQAS